MGAVATAGASLRPRGHWHQINWRRAHRNVRRLQIRIVQAQQGGKKRKVRALQHILTRSWSGRAVAVKRVTTNRGHHTPGVDHVLWDTPAKKAQAVVDLQHQGGDPLPLRRVAIPKRNGGTRYLGIPTMRDRARQALHWLALDPIGRNAGRCKLVWVSSRTRDGGRDWAMLRCVVAQDIRAMGVRRRHPSML